MAVHFGVRHVAVSFRFWFGDIEAWNLRRRLVRASVCRPVAWRSFQWQGIWGCWVRPPLA